MGLAVCLLFLSGLVYSQTVPHATHHAHHKATTHASALCSWMCAAGQGLEATPFVFNAHMQPVTVVDALPVEHLNALIPLFSRSRAPPVPSV